MLTTLLQCRPYFITSFMRLHHFVVVTNMAACVCLNCDIEQAKEKGKKEGKAHNAHINATVSIAGTLQQHLICFN